MQNDHPKFFKMMKEIKTRLTPYKTRYEKKLVGGRFDGAYVIADIKPDVCFSYGSNDDIKFENALFDTYGTPSIVFDHTIPCITNKPDHITFFKEGVFTSNDLLRQTKEYTGSNALLKMDIEGDEWKVLKGFPNLSKFKQIVLELHFDIGSYTYVCDIVQSLVHLTQTHTPIHVHGTRWPINPWLDINFPRVLEVTLLEKSLVSKEVDMSEYPSPLDWDFYEYFKFPSCTWWKDYFRME